VAEARRGVCGTFFCSSFVVWGVAAPDLPAIEVCSTDAQPKHVSLISRPFEFGLSEFELHATLPKIEVAHIVITMSRVRTVVARSRVLQQGSPQ
jgi:hypothetical protein